MKRLRSRVLVVLSILAAVVFLLDSLGWLRWKTVVRTTSLNPETGAARLAEDALLVLPSSVERSRRFPAYDLSSAPIELAHSALVRWGEAQRVWMPAHPEGYANLARAALIAGDVATAVPLLDDAVSRDPTSPSLRRLRSLMLMASGELSSALEDLAMAEAISPDLKVPAIDLTPEHQRSIRLRSLELRQVLYPRHRLQSMLALARAHRMDGDLESARSVLAGFEAHPEVSIQQARWAVEDGDGGSAIAMIEPLLDRQTLPRRLKAHAWSVMASARALIGDFEGATEAAQQALHLDRNSIHAYVSLAALAENRGDYERALDNLRRAWGMNPSNVSLLTRIARVAERAGRGPDALLAMERAVQIDPSSPDLAAGLVSLQLRQGRYSEAAVSLARALDRHPTSPQLLDLADRLRRDIGIR